MANISYMEQDIIEEFLLMKSGYLLDFTDRKFATFMDSEFSIDPYDSKYDLPNTSNSKANRFRGILKKTSDTEVASILDKLLQYVEYSNSINNNNDTLKNKYCKIITKLKKNNSYTNLKNTQTLDLLQDKFTTIKNVNVAINSILLDYKYNPDSNKTIIDRLHTLCLEVFKYIANKLNIDLKEEETLNAVYGKIIKWIDTNKKLQSETTIKILKANIQVMERFNTVRNTQSLAHPGTELLECNEADLLITHIIAVLKYITSIIT